THYGALLDPPQAWKPKGKPRVKRLKPAKHSYAATGPGRGPTPSRPTRGTVPRPSEYHGVNHAPAPTPPRRASVDTGRGRPAERDGIAEGRPTRPTYAGRARSGRKRARQGGFVKVGCIGLGDIAQKAYLPVLGSVPGIDLHLQTRTPATLARVGDAHRVPD